MAEYDQAAAQLAAVRELLEAFPGGMAPAGDDGCWVYVEEWNAFEERVQQLLAEPAPEAVARIEADLAAGERLAEAVRKYRDEAVFGSYGDVLEAHWQYERAKEGA